MSLVTTTGLNPRSIAIGTSASMSAVLPEPTGPPTPTLKTFRSAFVVMSGKLPEGSLGGEEPQLGYFVPHRHQLDKGSRTAHIPNRPREGVVRGCFDHGMQEKQDALRIPVIDFGHADRGPDATGGK